MAYTIDKNSITATATADPLVFRIDFDFTDDTIADVNVAWIYTWKHAFFMYNTNMTPQDITNGITVGVQLARKPSAETVVEDNLRNNRGIVVVRVNPDAPVVAQAVKIVEVDPVVVVKTQAV